MFIAKANLFNNCVTGNYDADSQSIIQSIIIIIIFIINVIIYYYENITMYKNRKRQREKEKIRTDTHTHMYKESFCVTTQTQSCGQAYL